MIDIERVIAARLLLGARLHKLRGRSNQLSNLIAPLQEEIRCLEAQIEGLAKVEEWEVRKRRNVPVYQAEADKYPQEPEPDPEDNGILEILPE